MGLRRKGQGNGRAGANFVLPENRASCYRALGKIGKHRPKGEPNRARQEPPCMVSPLRHSPDPLDPKADHLRPSRAPDRRHRQAAGRPRPDAVDRNDDLARLEASVDWLKREGMIARLAAEHRAPAEPRRLPRVSPLPPVSGIPPVDVAGSPRQRQTSTFLLAPPLACERLQLQLPRRRHRMRGALCLLIAGAIAGTIAYHMAAGRPFSAWGPAQAAALHAP